MINKYYDQDCNLGMLDGKTVAIIGFGAHLPDAGCETAAGVHGTLSV